MSVASEVSRFDATREVVMKARIVGGDRPASQAEEAIDEAQRSAFDRAGALVPPYEPATLVALFEHSNSLRQNVDAYSTNIHAHGHRFEPVIDLSSDDANDRIAQLIMAKRLRQQGRATLDNPRAQIKPPSEDEVLATRREIEEQMRFEAMRLRRFFENASLEFSFEELRARTGMDREITGNGYWEVLKDASGQIAQFNQIPSFTMRLMSFDDRATDCIERVKIDDITWGDIKVRKRFRRYVQVFESEAVFFKELGDPRVISSKTGRAFDSVAEMLAADPKDTEATEVLHFAIWNSRSAYGVPRWIGQLLAVLGSRQVDEINYSYFENKSVPPLAMLVSGGRVTEDTITRITDFIENEIKGKRNFHKLLVLEAEGSGVQLGEHSGRARIELKPLTQAMHNDALFQRYDEKNLDKVGMAFRLPRLLRGDIRDFNRATADAALEFAEQQVFAPERQAFDFIINRKIFPRLGIRFHAFRSNSPTTTDPLEQGRLVTEMAKEGVLTPAEARQEAAKVFNRDFRDVRAPWVRQPLSLTIAGIAPPPEAALVPGRGEEPQPEAEQPAATEAAPVELTGTDLASIVTVNEVRERKGLGNLKGRDGKDDPDGFLTVAEFKAKRTKAGEVVGEQTATGQVKRGNGGVEARADGLPPTLARQLERANLMSQARWLIDLRNAMTAAEEEEAQRAFEEAMAAEEEEDASAEDAGAPDHSSDA